MFTIVVTRNVEVVPGRYIMAGTVGRVMLNEPEMYRVTAQFQRSDLSALFGGTVYTLYAGNFEFQPVE